MPELHDLLEREAATYAPPSDLLERVRERSGRRERTRRAGMALAGVLVMVLAGGGLFREMTRPRPVQFDQTRHPIEDTWVSSQYFYRPQTMEIRAVDGTTFGLVITTDGSSACEGPSTRTGTGRLEGAKIVVPTLILECDDGRQPNAAAEKEEAPRNYTILYDAATDTLSDTADGEWVRQATATDPEGAQHPMGLWPLASTDEVRKAQRRANAGDPRYTWQVDRGLDADRAPEEAEIFSRFLTEELGWESFRRSGHPDDPTAASEHTSSVMFVRCAAGQPNPLYPDDPAGRSCAPTRDEFSYETVGVTAYQPFDAGPSGVWVVVSWWQPETSVRQTVPPSDADVADVLEAFGQARLDGKGAEAQLYEPEENAAIPLLYSTSAGAPYERFEFEVLDGPTWPDGRTAVNLRLFADGGKTVVEQRFSMERASGRWVLRRERSDFRRATTTENGRPASEPFTLSLNGDAGPGRSVDDALTYSIDPSWIDAETTDTYESSGIDAGLFTQPRARDHQFMVVANPLPPSGRCDVGNQPTSVDEMVRSLRSSPYLTVSAPAPAQVGTIGAVRLDVSSSNAGAPCHLAPVLAPRPWGGEAPKPVTVGPDTQARLYLFDVPGEYGHTVAIVIAGPKRTFDGAFAAAKPAIDSFEAMTD